MKSMLPQKSPVSALAYNTGTHAHAGKCGKPLPPSLLRTRSFMIYLLLSCFSLFLHLQSSKNLFPDHTDRQTQFKRWEIGTLAFSLCVAKTEGKGGGRNVALSCVSFKYMHLLSHILKPKFKAYWNVFVIWCLYITMVIRDSYYYSSPQ